MNRMGGGRLGKLAFKVLKTGVRAGNKTYPTIRKVFLRKQGRRTGNQLLVGKAPTEFAGHLAFRARKPKK